MAWWWWMLIYWRMNHINQCWMMEGTLWWNYNPMYQGHANACDVFLIIFKMEMIINHQVPTTCEKAGMRAVCTGDSDSCRSTDTSKYQTKRLLYNHLLQSWKYTSRIAKFLTGLFYNRHNQALFHYLRCMVTPLSNFCNNPLEPMSKVNQIFQIFCQRSTWIKYLHN